MNKQRKDARTDHSIQTVVVGGSKASPSPDLLKPVERPKLSRGRPYKTTTQKSSYSHLVLSERVIKSLDSPPNPLNDKPISDDEQRLQMVRKLSEIKEHSEANAYYWKLVFTYTFHLYRISHKADQLFPDFDASSKPGSGLRSLSVRQMAQAAGIEYLTLKNLFAGRGSMRNLADYQLFLYGNGIDFTQVQYNSRLVDKAYFYLICLRQTTVQGDALKDLFF